MVSPVHIHCVSALSGSGAHICVRDFWGHIPIYFPVACVEDQWVFQTLNLRNVFPKPHAINVPQVAICLIRLPTQSAPAALVEALAFISDQKASSTLRGGCLQCGPPE